MSPSQMMGIDVVQDHAYGALKSYLESDAELQDAVSSFIQPVYNLYAEKLPSESQLADALDALWSALLNEVISTVYNDTKQDHLVTFVSAIKSLPPPDQPAPQIWGLSLWSGLPLLGAAMRGRWNIGPNTEDDHWLNLNAFAARLTDSNVLDLSLYAIWAMRDALETPLEDIKPAARDQTLQAAALWIKFCGKHIHGMNKIWEPDPRKGDVARGGPLYSGSKGFCKERWELWSQRFDVLSREEKLEEKVRQDLKDAANNMSVALSS